MTQLTLHFDQVVDTELPTAHEPLSHAPAASAQANTAASPPTRKAEAMSRAAFIAAHRSSFVKYTKGRNIIGVQCADGRILPLPPGSQTNGRLLQPVDDVLAEIHRTAVEEEVTRVLRWRHTRREGFPGPEVLLDYPDLERPSSSGSSRAASPQSMRSHRSTSPSAPPPKGHRAPFPS
jgi:hypothetical protein